MSYRFVKITTFYPEYLRYYYSRNPQIVSQSYKSQLTHLLGDAYGLSNFFQIHLQELGVDAHEIISNAEPLQRAWAREHGLTQTGKDLVAQQIKALKPDVVMFQDSLIFNGLWVKDLRSEMSFIKLILGSCCTPFGDEEVNRFHSFDYLITCSPGFYDAFRKADLPTMLMYHAFEHTLLPRIEKNNNFPQTDLLFAGSFVSKSGFHLERIDLMENLLAKGVKMRIHTNLQRDSAPKLIAKKAAYYAAQQLKKMNLNSIIASTPVLKLASSWEKSPQNSEFSKAFHQSISPPVYGLEMLQALNHSKMGFNVHLDANPVTDYAANIRLFEVTGTGSCLVTDWKRNIKELFEPDQEIITYSSSAECVEKINWLMNHPDERAKIAKAGQARCLRDHTYQKRAMQLNEFILGNLRK
jgi:spore maturation protein CgeB